MSEYTQNTLKPCPKCGCTDLFIDSCRNMQTSEIICDECDFTLQIKGTEEALVKRWNNLQREGE